MLNLGYSMILLRELIKRKLWFYELIKRKRRSISVELPFPNFEYFKVNIQNHDN